MHDLRDFQLRREVESDAEASTKKLNELIQEASGGSLEHPRARSFIAGAYSKIYEVIDMYKERRTAGIGRAYQRWLQSIPTDVAALIAVREVTRICVSHQSSSAVTVQTLASSVGRLYELEVRIREATQVNALYMKRVQDALDDKNVRSFKHLMGVYTKAYKKVLGKDLMSTLTNSELVHLG